MAFTYGSESAFLVSGLGICGVGFGNPSFHHGIPSVLVVVVFVGLPSVIGRVANNHEDARILLPFDSNRIGFSKQVHLFRFRRLECIHKTDALECLVFPGRLVILVLDVHAGDVIRQQHDFVGVQLVREFVRQGAARDFTHEVHDEISRADERVENVHALGAECLAEFLLQNFRHALDYKAYDRRRRVNDAMRVGHLDAEALEELFINCVQKLLLLAKVSNGGGSLLYGDVKAVEFPEKVSTAEALRG